jgi:hypothetical protein
MHMPYNPFTGQTVAQLLAMRSENQAALGSSISSGGSGDSSATQKNSAQIKDTLFHIAAALYALDSAVYPRPARVKRTTPEFK